MLGIVKEGRYLLDKPVAVGDRVVNCQIREVGEPLSQRVIKHELAGNRIACEAGGTPKHFRTVANQRPALFVAHPAINQRPNRWHIVALDECLCCNKDRPSEKTVKGMDKILIRRTARQFILAFEELHEAEEKPLDPIAQFALKARVLKIELAANATHRP